MVTLTIDKVTIISTYFAKKKVKETTDLQNYLRRTFGQCYTNIFILAQQIAGTKNIFLDAHFIRTILYEICCRNNVTSARELLSWKTQ